MSRYDNCHLDRRTLRAIERSRLFKRVEARYVEIEPPGGGGEGSRGGACLFCPTVYGIAWA